MNMARPIMTMSSTFSKSYGSITSKQKHPYKTKQETYQQTVCLAPHRSIGSIYTKDHRYTRKIPEPAPFLSRHGAQIGGLWVFPVIEAATNPLSNCPGQLKILLGNQKFKVLCPNGQLKSRKGTEYKLKFCHCF